MQGRNKTFNRISTGILSHLLFIIIIMIITDITLIIKPLITCIIHQKRKKFVYEQLKFEKNIECRKKDFLLISKGANGRTEVVHSAPYPHKHVHLLYLVFIRSENHRNL